MSLSGFGFRVTLASQNKLGSVPSGSIFLEEREELVSCLPFLFNRIYWLQKSYGHDDFLYGDYKII